MIGSDKEKEQRIVSQSSGRSLSDHRSTGQRLISSLSLWGRPVGRRQSHYVTNWP